MAHNSLNCLVYDALAAEIRFTRGRLFAEALVGY